MVNSSGLLHSKADYSNTIQMNSEKYLEHREYIVAQYSELEYEINVPGIVLQCLTRQVVYRA